MDENRVRELVATLTCASCKRQYEPDTIVIVSRGDRIWFVRAGCSACHVIAYIAVVVRSQQPELITDLTDAELEHFRNADNVNEDDLLQMHRFLRDFNGDFPDIFNDPG